jgi:long-chain acyl-CoA synthetase
MQTVAEEELALQCLYRWERERAEHVFLTQPFDRGKVREWTWAQTASEARQMAAYLRANLEPGSRVAVISRNCAWSILADLSIWMAGHICVPIYPSLKHQSVRQIIEHSGATACFIGATDEKEVGESGVPAGVLCIRFPTAVPGKQLSWDAVAAEGTSLPGSPTRPASDISTIIYTSGTTGTPKGVMHSFSAFAFDARVLSNLLEIGEEQRFLSYLPLAHVVERAGMEAVALRLGCRIFFTEGIETFLADLQRARPTIFLSVPRLLLKFQQGVFAKIPKEKLDRLLKVPLVNWSVKRRILHQLGLNTVRHAACGAAPLPTDILLWYRKIGLDLAEGYGMSETLITHLPRPGSVRPGFVGAPLEGVEQKLDDKGELLIRSPLNMLGYYKDQQATLESLTPDGFFRTGDLAQIDPDGQLRIIGRIKEQFKTSKGKYVAPAPIESRLTTHPAVESCCLMGAGLPSPFAIVVLSADARKLCADSAAHEALERSLQAQMEEVNAQLDPHERVNFIAVVEGPWTVGNGMMTPTLKIRRNVLENSYQPYIESWRRRNTPIVWQCADAKPPANLEDRA